MQIKKSLNESAKRLTPAIEASNTGTQIAELAGRIVELLNYGENKEQRAKLSKETGMSFSEREKARRRKIALPAHEVMATIQAEDAKENAEDQAQVEAQPDVVETGDVVEASAR